MNKQQNKDNFVFVYGTLKSGHYNHHILSDSEFIGKATVKGQLLDIGPYPALIPQTDGQLVQGEIYKIDNDTLANLDHLEGEGRLYNRKGILGSLDVLKPLENEYHKGRYDFPVWAYFWGLGNDFPIIPTGNWE